MWRYHYIVIYIVDCSAGWVMRCFVLFCSTSHWQVEEEYMGHSGGDARSRSVWLRCRLHWRSHQGLPVWCVFASRQGERSALPRSTHRFVIQIIHTNTSASAHTPLLYLLRSSLPLRLCLFMLISVINLSFLAGSNMHLDLIWIKKHKVFVCWEFQW